MSKLGFMEKLLDGVEVEWKALGDALVRTKGTKITAGKMKELHKNGAPLKVFAGGRTVAFVNYEDIPAKDVNTEPSIIVKSRGVIEFEYYDKPFSHKNEMWSYHAKKAEINIRYAYHFLKLNEPHFQKIGSKMQMPQIATPDTDKFLIPIPCPENPKKSLEIQAEIVRILDTFTELTAKLTAELTARKKQYHYYRDQLLSFEETVIPRASSCTQLQDAESTRPCDFAQGDKKEEVEWKTLGEIALPTSNIRWRDTNRAYRYIDLTSVSRENNSIVETSEISAKNAPSRAQKLVEKNDVIFATTRPTQLRLCLIDGEYSGEVASTGYCVLRAKIGEVLPKWIYYHLSSTNFFNYAEENQSGSAYPAISDSKVKEFKLPIPYPNDPEKSLTEQARIVAILDKFDALTNSISEGLPREIELRQQQYEYYRDLLLSFPKPKDVVV